MLLWHQDFYNLFGVDEYPEVRLTGIPHMDFISIASTKAFAEIVFTMNTVRRLKTGFIRAVQSCVSGTVASRMYTLKDAIAALKRSWARRLVSATAKASRLSTSILNRPKR